MTSKSYGARYRVDIKFENVDGRVLIDQIRTLDRERFVKCLGRANDEVIQQALSIARVMFAE